MDGWMDGRVRVDGCLDGCGCLCGWMWVDVDDRFQVDVWVRIRIFFKIRLKSK